MIDEGTTELRNLIALRALRNGAMATLASAFPFYQDLLRSAERAAYQGRDFSFRLFAFHIRSLLF